MEPSGRRERFSSMKRLLALGAMVALTLGLFATPVRAAQNGMAETKISGIRVWVTIYHGSTFGRTIVGSGWMSAGHAYPHMSRTNHDTYYIRGQVHDDARGAHPIADTTAVLSKNSGVSIYLMRRGTNYYWAY